MKILQQFDLFSPSQGGGTVNLLYKLCQALAGRGHQTVIYTSDYALDQEYIDSLKGVRVHPFHCWWSLAGIYVMPAMIGEAGRRLKDFDVIHLHCFRSFQNWVIHHYARRYGNRNHRLFRTFLAMSGYVLMIQNLLLPLHL